MMTGYVEMLEAKGKKSAGNVKTQIAADIEKSSGRSGASERLKLIWTIA